MKYQFEYSIHNQDVDANSRLRLYTLENYLLDSAGLAADDLGIGYRDLLRDNQAWVLIRMVCELTYVPTVGDTIVIETWVNGFKHGLSPREFVLYRKTPEGLEPIAKAHSVWAVIDLTSRQLQNVFAWEPYLSIECHELLDLKTARLRPLQQFNLTDTYKIRYSDLDYNSHCNSCKYLEMMLNANHQIVDNWSEGQTLSFDLNYQHEVYLDDVVTINMDVQDNEITYDVICPNGEHSVLAKIAKI